MKIVCVADLHIANHKKFGSMYTTPGVNYRAQKIIDALKETIAGARAQIPPADILMICGDLFDNVRPTPQLLAATMSALSLAHDTFVYILVGNHDAVSSTRGDHALGPLFWAGDQELPRIVEEPHQITHKDVNLIMVPYTKLEYDTSFETYLYNYLEDAKLIDRVYSYKPTHRMMFIHAGIADEKTPWFLKGANDSIHVDQLFDIMDMHNIDTVIAGNWHNHALWEKGHHRIIQCGALVPTGFDNPSNDASALYDYGRIVCINTEETAQYAMYKQVKGPRFVNMEWEDLIADDTVLLHGSRHEFEMYLSVTAEVPHFAAAEEYCKEQMKQGVILGYEIWPNKDTEKAAARKASRIMNFSADLDSAVHDYVKHLQMPEGLKRKHVIEKVNGYIKK